MQTLASWTRHFTSITYNTLPPKRRAYNWELAHATLNASLTGMMSINEIVDDLFSRFPERFEGKESKWKSCRNSLANNMTISPDFKKFVRVPGGSCYYWVLTGSVQGVPRPDKKARAGGTTHPRPSSAARYCNGNGNGSGPLLWIHNEPKEEVLVPIPPDEDHGEHKEPSADASLDSDSDDYTDMIVEASYSDPDDSAELYDEAWFNRLPQEHRDLVGGLPQLIKTLYRAGEFDHIL
ncbi:hypothetical protein FRC00_007830 [Tulasnella sp. 408]|nr:hypothetical protein FRC00_007830 [Tulasnella sp. 408]